ncbi:Hsp20/alpha crystallin family protein [Streptomyces hirsutus]|uniref:Hsp20/alpha crystallin family protein n=1 Tax=Streptomyces hirsutus TaxID=35620 RepID=A0ABZ1GWD2_9ACTN|nr:Hsp20/alpha crystallin family protein [Streptomyces hirsutus]WSD10477.1 Hsp20/alpha crystallin family protein [Streptomyces hirsutus]WTD16175.1 Hsp20/alpha crystallin family protein [Streptomyces hirsutus]WTD79051.1 Hsp20/alpha crystallin family protein [Streptomyces sp. NBC_01635]
MSHPARRSRGPLSGWDAFRELEDLRSRMEYLMHSTFPFPGDDFSEAGTAGTWTPPADVEDTGDAHVVELELAGADKDRINVEVSDGELVVHGEIEERERTGVVRRHTRHVGRFHYRTALPTNADTERISAELTNGVLTVRVPRTGKGTQRRIEITG